MTIIAIVIGALGTLTTGLKRWLELLEMSGNSRPFRSQVCWDRWEYSEVSWRLEKTCCHTDSRESVSVNAVVKTRKEYNNNNAHNNNNDNSNNKRKNKWSTNIYINKKHNLFKWTHLWRIKISLWKSRGCLKEHEQKNQNLDVKFDWKRR